MKTLLILVGLLVGTSLHQTTQAQVNVTINIGSQPLWGPTGYDYVSYYYLPDLDIYYYVPLQQWIYFDGGQWITTTVLPTRYSSYDLYRMHKVVINDQQPYLHNATYRRKYASFKGRYDQQPIRDSRDAKYYVINNHPMHNQVAGGRQAGNPGMRPGHSAGPQARNARPQTNSGRQEPINRPQSEHRGPR